MERRVTSHTEEEEMNQRRRLLTLARKGDQKAVELLFELYQVRVFSGDALKKKKLPSFPVPNPPVSSGRGQQKSGKKMEKGSKLSPAEKMSKTEAGKTSQLKKTGSAAKTGGKPKRPKPAGGKKIKKSRPPVKPKRTSKREPRKKTASSVKTKHKKSTLSARPAKVKKK